MFWTQWETPLCAEERRDEIRAVQTNISQQLIQQSWLWVDTGLSQGWLRSLTTGKWSQLHPSLGNLRDGNEIPRNKKALSDN